MKHKRGVFLFYGQLKNKEYIFASEIANDKEVLCPDCGEELLLKKSNRGRYFFVHINRCRKDYGEGSHHFFWKMFIASRFEREKVQVEAQLANNRRSDLVVDGVAIEIQFSPISCELLATRIADYYFLEMEQRWIFKWPKQQNRDTLKLGPMELYVWQHTDLPLLYIDIATGMVKHVTELQFIRRNVALYVSNILEWEEVVTLRKSKIVQHDVMKLQTQWLFYRRKRIADFDKQRYFRTQTAVQIYALGVHDITLCDVGMAYTGNRYFVVSPLEWQVELLYLFHVKKHTTIECCRMMRKKMTLCSEHTARAIVEQVLAQF